MLHPTTERGEYTPPPIPHLTTRELCARLRCRPETITRSYQRWGLRPIRIAGAHLWPLDQIEELERRAMDGSLGKRHRPRRVRRAK